MLNLKKYFYIMKLKLLFVSAILLTGLLASSQIWQAATTYGKKENGILGLRYLGHPTGCGNPALPNATDSALKVAGSYYDTCNKRLWLYDPKLKAWDTVHIGIGGGGSSYTFTTPLLNTSGTVSLNGLSGYGTNGQLIKTTGSALQYFTPTYILPSDTAGMLTNYRHWLAGYLSSVDTGNITSFYSKVRSLFSATAPLSYANGVYSITGLSGVGSNGQLIRSNGSGWEYFTPSYITGNQTINLSGDVTGSGATAITTTIASNAVTDAKLRQSAGLSLIGRASNSTGNVADITAGSDKTVLARNGTSIGFNALDSSYMTGTHTQNYYDARYLFGRIPVKNVLPALKYSTADSTLYIRGLVSEEFLERGFILDSIATGTVKAAYSLSKLKSSYTGPAIRVINPTTTVQTDVGFDPDGNLDAHFAKTLFDAGDTLQVVKLYDQSGNGLDATASGTKYKLDLGGYRPALLTGTKFFTGAAYRTSGTTSLTTPTYFFTSEMYNENGQQILFDIKDGNQFQYRMEGGTSTGKRFQATNGSFVTFNDSYLTDSAIASDGIYQTTMAFRSGNDTVRVNSTKTYTGVDAGNTARSSAILSIGDYAPSASIPWYGRIFEAIIMDGTIDSVDRNKIEVNQKDYYQKGKRIVALGTSLTYGTGVNDFYNESYVYGLKKQMSEGWDVADRGSAGDYITNMIRWRYEKEVKPLYRPGALRNVVVLDAGTNDIVAGMSAANLADSIALLCNKIKADGWEVYVRCLPIQNAWPSYSSIFAATNVILAANWQNYADGFLDSRTDPDIGEATGNPSNATYFTDGIHKTAAGYYREASYGASKIDNGDITLLSVDNTGALILKPAKKHTELYSRDHDVFAVQATNSDGRFSVGTIAPDTSAKLEVSSFNKGVLLPRLTGEQQASIGSPATGLIVYNTDSLAFVYYDGTSWRKMASASGGTVTPGGPSGSVQINGSGLFTGSDGLNYNLAGRKLSVDSILDIADAGAELHAGSQKLGYRLGSQSWRWTYNTWSRYVAGFDQSESWYANGGVNGLQIDVTATNTQLQTPDHNNLGLQVGNTSGKVGIGTLSPSSKLTVTNSSLAGVPLVDLSTTTTAAASNSQTLLTAVLSGANANATQTTYSGYFGNNHTGTASTNYGIIGVAENGTTNIGIRARAAGGSNNYAFIVDNGDGNSGFGTPSPTATVHISGSLRYVDGNQSSGKVLTSDGSGNATWQTAGSSGMTFAQTAALMIIRF